MLVSEFHSATNLLNKIRYADLHKAIDFAEAAYPRKAWRGRRCT